MLVQTLPDQYHLHRMFVRLASFPDTTRTERDAEGREWPTYRGIRIADMDLPKPGREYAETRAGADELLEDFAAFLKRREGV